MQTNVDGPKPVPSVLRSEGQSWPATLSAAFVELEFQQLDGPERPIEGSIYQYPFGDLTFQRSITTGQPHRVTRSERLIRTSAHDNFFVGLLLSGGAIFSQDGRTAALRPGDIALLDSTRVYTIEVPQSFDALWIRTPRNRLVARVRDVDHIMASKIEGGSGIGHVASEMLRAALVEAPRLSRDEANRVANTFLDLIGVALRPKWRPVARPLPTPNAAALLRRVREYIEPRLDDEGLTPSIAARANRVSVRYVNKLLAPEGYTLARWIRVRRLERCRLDFESVSASTRRIADIAYSHGFKNVSHFNRLFRARFGCSPGAFLRRQT